MKSICKKTSQKLNALERITPYMNKAAKNNHEVFCNFSIYLLSINLDVPQYNNIIRRLNNKINYIYERAL